jgi:Transposase, Mutator family
MPAVREIQGHVAELYGTEVSPDLISRVTDAVLDEVRDWQNRPLDPVYPVVFFDALRVKIRDEGLVKNKAVYVALALNPDGEKDVLGLWIEQTEGAKFWLKVVNELKARGVNDILIAVVDGLKGFPDAITSVFPQTLIAERPPHRSRRALLTHRAPPSGSGVEAVTGQGVECPDWRKEASYESGELLPTEACCLTAPLERRKPEPLQFVEEPPQARVVARDCEVVQMPF